MSGRNRATARPLLEHFFWTVIAASFLMVGVVVLSYVAQAADPAQVIEVCRAGWKCDAPVPAATP